MTHLMTSAQDQQLIRCFTSQVFFFVPYEHFLQIYIQLPSFNSILASVNICKINSGSQSVSLVGIVDHHVAKDHIILI